MAHPGDTVQQALMGGHVARVRSAIAACHVFCTSKKARQSILGDVRTIFRGGMDLSTVGTLHVWILLSAERLEVGISEC